MHGRVIKEEAATFAFCAPPAAVRAATGEKATGENLRAGAAAADPAAEFAQGGGGGRERGKACEAEAWLVSSQGGW